MVSIRKVSKAAIRAMNRGLGGVNSSRCFVVGVEAHVEIGLDGDHEQPQAPEREAALPKDAFQFHFQLVRTHNL
jgi:hypothetical protein